jgi:hypothetical protein
VKSLKTPSVFAFDAFSRGLHSGPVSKMDSPGELPHKGVHGPTGCINQRLRLTRARYRYAAALNLVVTALVLASFLEQINSLKPKKCTP